MVPQEGGVTDDMDLPILYGMYLDNLNNNTSNKKKKRSLFGCYDDYVSV